MGSGGLPGSWCKLCWAYCTLGHTRPPCTDQKGSTGHEGVIEDAFLPDPDAAARGKSDLLAGGIWSSCHRFWCSCRLLSARSLLSFFSFFWDI